MDLLGQLSIQEKQNNVTSGQRRCHCQDSTEALANDGQEACNCGRGICWMILHQVARRVSCPSKGEPFTKMGLCVPKARRRAYSYFSPTSRHFLTQLLRKLTRIRCRAFCLCFGLVLARSTWVTLHMAHKQKGHGS